MTFGPTRSVAVLILGAVLAGCAPKAAELVLDTRQVPPATVISRVTANASRVSTLTGRGTVSFEAPGMGGSALDRKSTRLNSSHLKLSRMPSSA